jgi:exopolysaccharide biosynthesis WecB/TagA/CpsF family protein
VLRAERRKELANLLFRGRARRGRRGRRPDARSLPGAQIVGFRDGFFTPDDEAQIIEQIRAARPDILLVALGIPKQEKFIARHKQALGVPVCVGVGGTLDVFSGTVKRAPRWMQNSGLEWLYRVASNPKKISKVALLPRFVWMTLRDSSNDAGKRRRPTG